MQLLEVLDKWTEILEVGDDVDVIYFDFAKTFDTVPHQKLLGKLESYRLKMKDPVVGGVLSSGQKAKGGHWW